MQSQTNMNLSQNAGLNTKTTHPQDLQQNMLANSLSHGIDPALLIDIKCGVISDAVCHTEEAQLEFDRAVKGTAGVAE